MHKMIKYRMYFGRNIAGIPEPITRGSFNIFLKRSVDVHFTGYTVFEATGCWNGLHEKAWVIEFIVDLVPYGMNKEPDLQEIAEAYRSDFDQESVMITKEFIDVSF